MQIDELMNLWQEDSIIDKTELGDESLKIPKLHHKYYQILVHERLLLRKLEFEFKELKLSKHTFYQQGHTQETREKGWELPPKGLILKSEIPLHLEADKDIIHLSLRIGLQMEKIDFLESVIKSIMNRGYAIRNCIDWTKFTMGG